MLTSIQKAPSVLCYTFVSARGHSRGNKFGDMVKNLRKKLGDVVFNSWVVPPKKEGIRLRSHPLDYGHAFLYEDRLGEESKDIQCVVELSRQRSGSILDLAGGSGRIAEQIALSGKRVTLVDNSKDMLALAKKKWRNLSLAARNNLNIECQDITSLNIDFKFSQIFCVRNGLEHVGEEKRLVRALENVRTHLTPGGRFFAEVHRPEYWEVKPGWKQGKWGYAQDIRCQTGRYRVWERTFEGHRRHEIIWEHAITRWFARYMLLRTVLCLYSKEKWCEFFSRARFNVAGVWGTWEQTASSEKTPSIVFELTANKGS